MLATIQLKTDTYQIDLRQPLEIGIPLRFDGSGPQAWYAPYAEAEPIRAGEFVGSVRAGGAVNFYQLRMTPHGNGTHTECVGHIAPEWIPLTEVFDQFWFLAQVISLYPQKRADGERCIERAQLEEALEDDVPALVIRTLPNDALKLRTNYSGANPPYLSPEAASLLAERGIQHLLIDLPSIDPESDGGALAAHRAFWAFPEQPRRQATITELIYVPAEVTDGLYLLELQVPAFHLDAAPSRPLLYRLIRS